MPGPRLEGRFSTLLPIAPVPAPAQPPSDGAAPRPKGGRRPRKRVLVPRDPTWRLGASEAAQEPAGC
ncbi:hypothetical protein GMJLKIPL_1936 [Methylobacterium isbiliense]|uniref:Uncharacterized protein n=1 Tax=Methylobacterium isbiliense TaxID=315478 RepID=A0ABQ4SDY4_9HYPH|nr:hypothetical protein GMJLKIPL_1936 [Methylobacterium isbiliense]